MASKTLRHVCSICFISRRPVGRPVEEGHGWSVYRWYRIDPVASGLRTKGEAMKLLWALKHQWSSVRVVFWNGRVSKLDLRAIPDGAIPDRDSQA